MTRALLAYSVVGTTARGAAARVKGSIAYEAMRSAAHHAPAVRIGHPAGVIDILGVSSAGLAPFHEYLFALLADVRHHDKNQEYGRHQQHRQRDRSPEEHREVAAGEHQGAPQVLL